LLVGVRGVGTAGGMPDRASTAGEGETEGSLGGALARDASGTCDGRNAAMRGCFEDARLGIGGGIAFGRDGALGRELEGAIEGGEVRRWLIGAAEEGGAGGASSGARNTDVALRSTAVARSAAALASSSALSSSSASDAASAARLSHLSASVRSPRCHIASAVESAQETSSTSSAFAAGIGASAEGWAASLDFFSCAMG
jgi:hypothetical protein